MISPHHHRHLRRHLHHHRYLLSKLTSTTPPSNNVKKALFSLNKQTLQNFQQNQQFQQFQQQAFPQDNNNVFIQQYMKGPQSHPKRFPLLLILATLTFLLSSYYDYYVSYDNVIQLLQSLSTLRKLSLARENSESNNGGADANFNFSHDELFTLLTQLFALFEEVRWENVRLLNLYLSPDSILPLLTFHFSDLDHPFFRYTAHNPLLLGILSRWVNHSDELGTQLLQDPNLGRVLVHQFLTIRHPRTVLTKNAKNTKNEENEENKGQKINDGETEEEHEANEAGMQVWWIKEQRKRKQALELLEQLTSNDRLLSSVAYDSCIDSFVMPLVRYLVDHGEHHDSDGGGAFDDNDHTTLSCRNRVAHCLLNICSNVNVQQCHRRRRMMMNMDDTNDRNMNDDGETKEDICTVLESYLARDREGGDPIGHILKQCCDYLKKDNDHGDKAKKNDRDDDADDVIVRHQPTQYAYNLLDVSLVGLTTIVSGGISYVYVFKRWRRLGAPKVYARYNAKISASAMLTIGALEVLIVMAGRNDVLTRKTLERQTFGNYDTVMPEQYKRLLASDPRLARGVPLEDDSTKMIVYKEMIRLAQYTCFALAWYRLKFFLAPVLLFKGTLKAEEFLENALMLSSFATEGDEMLS